MVQSLFLCIQARKVCFHVKHLTKPCCAFNLKIFCVFCFVRKEIMTTWVLSKSESNIDVCDVDKSLLKAEFLLLFWYYANYPFHFVNRYSPPFCQQIFSTFLSFCKLCGCCRCAASKEAENHHLSAGTGFARSYLLHLRWVMRRSKLFRLKTSNFNAI